jgi:hypothetical protein
MVYGSAARPGSLRRCSVNGFITNLFGVAGIDNFSKAEALLWPRGPALLLCSCTVSP